MKYLLATALVTIMSMHSAAAAPQSCAEKIEVKVNGLVCDFCARSIEKMFGKRDDVSSIEVDLNNGLVTLGTKVENTLDDALVTQMVTDAGYNVTDVSRECTK